jgi:16S rRNA (uracil1498-N3)-methyltransferase
VSERAWAFVDSVDEPHLDDTDRHHLARVLRMRAGDALVVSDGRGRWRRAVLADGGAVEPDGDVVEDAAPAPTITIAFAITKGERPELAVQKLTELGADRIVPFAAARSVARWDGERAAKHVQRLRRVAREAAMQCRRSWLPEIDDATTFEVAASLPGASLADAGASGGPTLDRPTVLVGPEGGWDPQERVWGLPAVGLGPHVLRAETAAMAAAALLVGQRARLVRPFEAQ